MGRPRGPRPQQPHLLGADAPREIPLACLRRPLKPPGWRAPAVNAVEAPVEGHRPTFDANESEVSDA